MQQRSSITITAPEPSIVPACGQRVEVERRVDLRRAVSTGTDEPPGMTAFSSRPSGMPPPMVVDQLAERRAELELVVAAVDDVAGEREDARPGRVAAPILAYSAPPSSTIAGTVAIVSTLLISVGEA